MSGPGGAAARSTWDANASCYPAQERLEARAVGTALRLAAVAPGERLVDLATGTGLVLRALAKLPTRPAEAIGVDHSAAMLAQGGALPAGWRTVQADARDVPLGDGSADVVTCAFLLHLLEPGERRAVLGEARRLLRDGGTPRLVVVTVWVDRRRPGGWIADLALRTAASARPARWGGLAPLDPTADLRAAGLRLTHRRTLRRGGYPSLVIRAVPD